MALLEEILRVTTEQLKLKIVASGLADDQVFEAVNFSGVDDLVSSLFPKMKVTLEDEALIYAKVLLATAAYQPLAPYLVAMGKGSIRRLHRGDGCWKAKALAFREYEILEDEPPSQDRYDHYCRKCWPHTSPPVPEAAEDGSASSSGSSSSGA